MFEVKVFLGLYLIYYLIKLIVQAEDFGNEFSESG
tara:strand:- start:894 stop:998 length:105 start_codon:yes stop_codon:yes gene_type:complete